MSTGPAALDEGELACDDDPGDCCVGERRPVGMNDNEDVLITGGCFFCCWNAFDSDMRRWWKGAQDDVWEAKESVFSKVRPHLQRKGILKSG